MHPISLVNDADLGDNLDLDIENIPTPLRISQRKSMKQDL